MQNNAFTALKQLRNVENAQRVPSTSMDMENHIFLALKEKLQCLLLLPSTPAYRTGLDEILKANVDTKHFIPSRQASIPSIPPSCLLSLSYTHSSQNFNRSLDRQKKLTLLIPLQHRSVHIMVYALLVLSDTEKRRPGLAGDAFSKLMRSITPLNEIPTKHMRLATYDLVTQWILSILLFSWSIRTTTI